MTNDEFKKLVPGDVVRHVNDQSNGYLVHANYGDCVIASRVIDMTNPDEWVLVNKFEKVLIK